MGRTENTSPMEGGFAARSSKSSSLRRMQSEAQIGGPRPLPSTPRPREHGQPGRAGFWNTVLDRPHPSLAPTSSFHMGVSSTMGSSPSSHVQPSQSFHMGASSLSNRSIPRGPPQPKRPYYDSDVTFSAVTEYNTDKDNKHHPRQQRPFQCPMCEVGFSQKSHLNQHVRTVHQKVRPHKCPQCDKAFGKKYDLSSHQDAVHANERPHACDLCPKRFAKRSNLTRHREKLHPERAELKRR